MNNITVLPDSVIKQHRLQATDLTVGDSFTYGIVFYRIVPDVYISRWDPNAREGFGGITKNNVWMVNGNIRAKNERNFFLMAYSLELISDASFDFVKDFFVEWTKSVISNASDLRSGNLKLKEENERLKADVKMLVENNLTSYLKSVREEDDYYQAVRLRRGDEAIMKTVPSLEKRVAILTETLKELTSFAEHLVNPDNFLKVIDAE